MSKLGTAFGQPRRAHSWDATEGVVREGPERKQDAGLAEELQLLGQVAEAFVALGGGWAVGGRRAAHGSGHVGTAEPQAVVAMVAVGTTFGVTVGTAQVQSTAASPDSKQKEKNLVAGEEEAKRLLLLMDRDKSGKVSRQEFMNFMAEEFERLDINKDGELDVQELTRSRLTPHVGTHR